MEQFVVRGRDSASGSYVHEEVVPDHAQMPRSTPARGQGRAALIWGIGSTVLSVLGFLAWGLFEQYNSSLAELRADLKHFNEASSTFVKKDSMTRFRDQAKAQFKEMQSVSLSNKQLEAELKASEKAREDTSRELSRIRERLAFVEGRQSVFPSAPVNPDDHPPEAPRLMSREE